ncbi:MAG: hypothetical protein ACYSUI_18085, partial [Planctomycetota bacterium]
MSGGSRAAFWTTFATGALLAALAILGLALWEGTVQVTWVPAPATTTTAPATTQSSGWSHEIQTRAVAEVWRD